MTSEEKVIIREKRKEPREEKHLKFRLIPNGQISKFEGETTNLSCIGANCRMNKPIPELTRVDLTLDIVSEEITFEGVVVRSEKIEEDAYDIAIYFSDIGDRLKTKINDFINLKAIIND